MVTAALRAYHEANRYFDIFDEEGLRGKKAHIENVIAMAEAIAVGQHSMVDKELLKILAEHHDDGRVDQFKLLGKFWDSERSHNELGAERIDSFLKEKNLQEDEQVRMMKNVILYHGRQEKEEGLDEKTMEYIEIITAADDFENACACVSYLVTEADTDAKGYRKKYPSADQKVFLEFVWEHFVSGEKYDKSVYCHTYAEYTLFAATLATMCIKRYGSLAKTALMQPGYGYTSSLDGFRVVFERLLKPDDAARAYKLLSEMIEA